MSLTSYRAAPPRVGVDCVVPCVLGDMLFVWDGLEDLAAAYSPVP